MQGLRHVENIHIDEGIHVTCAASEFAELIAAHEGDDARAEMRGAPSSRSNAILPPFFAMSGCWLSSTPR
jgi:hypothetical protein